MTMQTPAAAGKETWLRVQVRFFHLIPAPDPKDKRRILPESTTALRIRDHLWSRPRPG